MLRVVHAVDARATVAAGSTNPRAGAAVAATAASTIDAFMIANTGAN
jgi:hypothetical protein